jgi:hypothetical protein
MVAAIDAESGILMATRSYRPRLRALCLLAGLALVELCAPHGGPVGFVTPASAQFFDDRFPFLGDRRNRSNNSNWNRDFRDRDRDWRDWRENRPAPVQDFSKAPAPKKPDAAAAPAITNIVVMGDSMADWLGYGLESAFADTPEIAVVRKQRHPSGLIRDLKPDSPDWPQIARETLNADKSAAYVVMMIGLNDRQQIRERPAPRRAAAQPNQPLQLNPAQPAPPPAAGQAAQNPPPDAEGEPPPAATPAPEQAPAGPGAPHEFRSEKWAELYGKRIEETVAALKSKGVPVFWVGLPSIRGAKSTSEAIYLNELYRSHAEKAGITYIDVWDGFVDEAGRFTVQGPDFEGQIRRLRTGDGVHFTQAGARKLAHYVEREIRRSIAARGLPVAAIPPTTAPEEPAQPAVPADKPGLFPRPMAGPVVPLTARQASDQTLLGGGGTAKSAEPETAGTRVLVKGEPVPAPAGRSDDFAWPRRGVMPVGADPVVATSTEPPPVAQPVAPPPVQTAAGAARPGAAEVGRQAAAPVRRTPVVRQQPRYDPWRSNPWGGGWGGWGGGGGLFRW